MFTAPGNVKPNFTTGWSAAPNTGVTFTVPDNWQGGRIWGRRDCDFSTNPGPNSCVDGGCNGGLVCDPVTGTGVPPATLAEFTLSAGGNTDFYDVSLVDGFNLPLRIDNNMGCTAPECAVDLNPNCPSPLKGPFDSSGAPVGCKSACFANLDGNQRLQHLTSVKFPPSNLNSFHNRKFPKLLLRVIRYARYMPKLCYFKNNCPTAYAYPYDDATALFTCSSSKSANFKVTFCPSS
ncbi:hypothetical protein CVT26_000490 [Gymnopilus dilepis]|uniref:Thaumatin-like protein n=1 Tax=Gymnopilus dilepis TaxID=231916 RepID=A0A409VGY8_9AGAR|nr:hypothetical protein CVT26_000490 [Gymnopilus dilepis]